MGIFSKRTQTHLKSLIAILLLATSVVLVASCAKNKDKTDRNDGDTDKRESYLYDYENENLEEHIKTGQYKGLEIEIDKIEIKDEEVENEIKKIFDKHNIFNTLTSRKAEKNDIVNVDYKGYMDGKEFEGGAAENAKIVLSDNSGYIDGFASGIIGHLPKTEFSVFVTFPKDYGYKEYAGKKAEFVMKLNYIYDYTVTDEIAHKYSDGKCKNAEEFNAYIKEKLHKGRYDTAIYEAVMKKISETSTVIEYPVCSVNHYYDVLRNNCERVAASLGATFEEYLSYIGLNEKMLVSYAENYTKNDLIIYSIAKAEKLMPTSEEKDSFAKYFTQNFMQQLTNEMLAKGFKKDQITTETATEYAKENHSKDIQLECMKTKLNVFLIANNKFIEK